MASKNEIRALKRMGRVTLELDENGEWESTWRVIPAGPHVPNKNEAQLLRRLMAQTGLTEAELREHKTYRQQLAQARSARGTKSAEQRYGLRLRKQVLRELKLPKEHPAVKAAFLARAQQGWGWLRPTPERLWAVIARL